MLFDVNYHTYHGLKTVCDFLFLLLNNLFITPVKFKVNVTSEMFNIAYPQFLFNLGYHEVVNYYLHFNLHVLIFKWIATLMLTYLLFINVILDLGK